MESNSGKVYDMDKNQWCPDIREVYQYAMLRPMEQNTGILKIIQGDFRTRPVMEHVKSNTGNYTKKEHVLQMELLYKSKDKWLLSLGE